jgi:hypothetical protein
VPVRERGGDLASKERSLVRTIAAAAWNDTRKRPSMWLLLSASFLPLVFLVNFLVPGYVHLGAPPASQLAIYFAGYTILYSLSFLFWCMAVLLYDDQARSGGKPSYRAAFVRMEGRAWISLLAGLVSGLVALFAYQFAQIIAGLLLSFLYGSQTSTGGLIALELIGYYVGYLAAVFIIVFIAMVPQMLALEGGGKVEEVLKASYRLVKERYRDALSLFLLPEIIIRTVFIGAIFMINLVPGLGLIFVLLLLCMALLEGGRTAYVAAAFNRLYYHVLEEEKKKKKVKTGKKVAAKQAAEKRSTAKQPVRKRPAGKQAKKR